MKCPLCQVEMRIARSFNTVENDDTPDRLTKLYVVQNLTCVNKACKNYDKDVETIKTEIPIG